MIKIDPKYHDAKIMIVDDEVRNTEILTRLLNGCGFKNVLHINESRHAIGIIGEFEPDIILLDLKMPECDGFEIMRQLKEGFDDILLPVLVLTAQRDQATRIRALEAGAKDFLSKPFDFTEGITRIRNLVEVRYLYKQAREQNRILEVKVRQRSQELEATRLETVQRLSRAAEYRDNETGLHVARIGLMSQALAGLLGMSEAEQACMLHASPMHDIGKIGIPDNILLKPGKLTPEEWSIMRTHPEIGGRILSGGTSDILKYAEAIALSHHERWDGSGYPRGLKGEEIPLSGRIVTVCDVFDALTSQRPYKKAWSVDEALTEIRSRSGSYYDPYLVKKFEAGLADFVDIVYKLADRPNSEAHLFQLNRELLATQAKAG